MELSGISHPPTVATVQGSEELERWRRRQLRNIAWWWGAPGLSMLLGFGCSAVGAWPLALILMLPAVTALLIAPALTAVFLLRYRQAGRTAEHLPRMPKAKVLSRRAVAALPAGSAASEPPATEEG